MVGDIERNQQTDRKTIGGEMAADYSITEFTRAGASLTGTHQTYTGTAGSLDDTLTQWAATLFAERGSMAYGPKWINPEGVEAAVVRDPDGQLLELLPMGYARSLGRA